MQNSAVTTGILRPDIKLLNREGQPLLFDPGADAYFKISTKILEIISYMTEKCSLTEFQKKLADNGILATEEELLEIIVFLQQNNLLTPEYGEITAKQKQLRRQKERTRLLRFSSAYLFFRLPPWRPEKFFRRIAPFVSFFASKSVVILLLFFALPGYLLLLRDAPQVKAAFADTLSWAGLVKYFLAIILLKILHEAAHSIAAIHFHCRVRGIGLGFMLFYPRLYTDTTDSWRLPRKQRLLIDAAGIIAELLIGGIAALLWSSLPGGSLKSTMFYIFAVSTLSTLLVNGNPFIRYDGYYILCDLLNIENLMQRASNHIKQWWRYYLLKLGTPPQDPNGKFLFCFGICSFCYKIFLYTSIILVIYHSFTKTLAVIMLLLEFYAILFYPCWVEFQTLRRLTGKHGVKSSLFLLAGILLSGGFILFLPLSWGIELPGEIVPQFRLPVTIPESGFLQEKSDHAPRKVRKGEILFRLKNPLLETGIKKLEATTRCDQTQLLLQQLDEKEYSNAKITEKKIQSDLVALSELRRRQARQTVKAEADGIFVKNLPDLSPGIYLSANTDAGAIISEKQLIYAYANDREIAGIHKGMTAEITAGDALHSIKGEVIFIDSVPGKLPPGPLLQPFGGPIPVYPAEKEFIPVQTLYRITLKPLEPPKFSSGRSVTVKLHHKERAGKYLIRFLLTFFRKEF